MTRVGPAVTADLLATIVAATRRIVEVREAREPLSALAKRAERRSRPAGVFHAALQSEKEVRPLFLENGEKGVVPLFPTNAVQAVPRIIAESKRRSPAKGVLRAEYDPVAIAKGYVDAGAIALSVLTEPTFFDGALEHLAAIRKAVDVPLLRKDFIVSEYQLLEAKAAGADAVLLIVAALDPADVARLHSRAEALGLDVLVEVHSGEELSVAIDAGARIVGVNNRNLRTLDVDVRASESLIAVMPRNVVAVSESGLRTAEDLRRLQQLGYRGFLIGERFMTQPDPGAELRALLQACTTTKDTKVKP